MTKVLQFNSQAFDTIFETKHNLMKVSERFPYKAAVLREYDSLDKPWYVEYYVWDQAADKLKRKRMVLAQTSKKARRAEADKFIPLLNERLADGWILNPRTPAPTEVTEHSLLTEAVAYFLLYSKSTNSDRTWRGYTSDFKHLLAFLEVHQLTRIKLKDFSRASAHRWLDWLTIHKKMANRRRNNLKAVAGTMFNFYVERKLLATNPMHGIGKLPTVSQKHRPFAVEDIARYKAHCLEHDPQLWLFVNFIYYCMIRPGVELRCLRVADIQEKTILIRGVNAKNDKTQHVRIPAALEALIVEYALRQAHPEHYVFSLGGPGPKCVGRNYFYKKNLAVLQALDIQDGAHDLYCWKHTGVIALFKRTQNIELIREQCRHADIGTTQEYLRDLGLFFDYEGVDEFPAI